MTALGELGILNVGTGDTKLSFDPTRPAERKRAAKVVMDMLERGYAILIQVGERDGKPLYQRAEAFDPDLRIPDRGTPDEEAKAPAASAGKAKRVGASRRDLSAASPSPGQPVANVGLLERFDGFARLRNGCRASPTAWASGPVSPCMKASVW